MIRTYEIDFDDALVDSASEIFETLGTDIDTAINMFLRQAVLRKGFPFRIVIPGADEGSEAEEREEPSAVPPVSQEVAARVEANEALVAAMRSEIGDKAVTPEFDENEDDGTHGDYDAAPSPESDGIAAERGAPPEPEITVGSEIMPEPAIADEAELSDEAEIAAEPATVSESQMTVVAQAAAESERAAEPEDETEPAIAAEIEINAELAATTEPEIASESSPATEPEITSESATAVSDDEDEDEAAPENLFDSWDVGEEEDVGCR